MPEALPKEGYMQRTCNRLSCASIQPACPILYIQLWCTDCHESLLPSGERSRLAAPAPHDQQVRVKPAECCNERAGLIC